MADDSTARPHERILARCERTPDGCLEFMGARNPHGYGRVRVANKTYLAHRFVYTALVGAIPERAHLHHECSNHSCVEPSHLIALSALEHVHRGSSPPAINHRKTRCFRGHELSGENLRIYRRPDGSTDRCCRKCARIRKGREA